MKALPVGTGGTFLCVVFAFALGFGMSAWATPKPRDQALRELSQAPATIQPQSPATVEIRQDILAREEAHSPWSLGLFVQFFEPGGLGSQRGGSEYQLNQLKPTSMFRLEGRWYLDSVTKASATWLPQVTAQASYSSQDVNLTTATGFRYQHTRLSTLLTSTGFRLGLRPKGWPTLEPAVGLGLGQALNFQTSKSDSATFSKSNSYWSMTAALRWFLLGQWSMEMQLESRSPFASTAKVDVQHTNLMIGVNWGRGQ
ncbi:MAG: hypothetical protein H6624_04265 [Bdellovibrionaceae bacterium]|nr:hypothetical protein [Bdellovibrionales bacterium]MCB9083530.1 hypothetical protein [Pseudobdellovibrionaceae bacterium]